MSHFDSELFDGLDTICGGSSRLHGRLGFAIVQITQRHTQFGDECDPIVSDIFSTGCNFGADHNNMNDTNF